MSVMPHPWALDRGIAHPITVVNSRSPDGIPAHNPEWE